MPKAGRKPSGVVRGLGVSCPIAGHQPAQHGARQNPTSPHSGRLYCLGGKMLTLIPIALLSYYLSVFLHELAHFWAARRFGINPDALMVGAPPWLFRGKVFGLPLRIGLIPLGGWTAMEVEEVNRLSPFQVAMVFLAGPLASLLMGLFALLLLSYDQVGLERLVGLVDVLIHTDFIGETNQEESLALMKAFLLGLTPAQAFLASFAVSNLVNALLNLPPLPPLDGGGALFFWMVRFPWGEKLFLGLSVLTMVLTLAFIIWLVALDESKKPPAALSIPHLETQAHRGWNKSPGDVGFPHTP